MGSWPWSNEFKTTKEANASKITLINNNRILKPIFLWWEVFFLGKPCYHAHHGLLNSCKTGCRPTCLPFSHIENDVRHAAKNRNIFYARTQGSLPVHLARHTERKMWRKLFGNKEFESTLLKLTSETGAPREVAEKVLRECNGDLTVAKQKLQGQHSTSMASKGAEKAPSSSSSSPYTDAPPSYSEAIEGAMALPTPLPPPYVSQEKDSLLGELKAVFPDHDDERCCTCFDPIRPDKEEGFSGEMIWQGLKVSLIYVKRHTF